MSANPSFICGLIVSGIEVYLGNNDSTFYKLF